MADSGVHSGIFVLLSLRTWRYESICLVYIMICDMRMREYQKISSKLLNNVIYIQISPIRHKTLQKQQEKCYYKIIEIKTFGRVRYIYTTITVVYGMSISCTRTYEYVGTQRHAVSASAAAVRVERERSCT